MMTTWQRGREARDARIKAGEKLAKGKFVEARDATNLLEAVVRPGDRVCLEGDNQKKADLLSAGLLRSLDRGGRVEQARASHRIRLTSHVPASRVTPCQCSCRTLFGRSVVRAFGLV